jgi:hypothetical protein
MKDQLVYSMIRANHHLEQLPRDGFALPLATRSQSARYGRKGYHFNRKIMTRP